MNLYAVIRRNCFKDMETLMAGGARSAMAGETMADRIRWVRTSVLRDAQQLGTICYFEATDSETVREHSKLAELPVDEVVLVESLMLSPDPDSQAATVIQA